MTDMPKYKLCPACNTQNPPWLLECAQCEADLTAVKITDDAISRYAEIIEETPAGPLPGELCRLCDCGAPNPPQARKCGLCGEDIGDIRPEVFCEPLPEPAFILQDDNSFCFNITDAECVLGRNAEPAGYLNLKSFVSRRHAKLNLCNGVLFIENLSATNPTFVNGKKLTDGQPVALKNGDEICLGGRRQNGEIQPQAACFTLKVQI